MFSTSWARGGKAPTLQRAIRAIKPLDKHPNFFHSSFGSALMTRGSVGTVRLAAMPSERASWQTPSFSDFGVFFRRIAAGIKSLFFDIRGRILENCLPL